MTRFPTRRRSPGSRILEGLGITALVGVGIVGVILVGLLLFGLGVAFWSVIVWFAWNFCGLHTVFGQPALTFFQVLGVAVALKIIRYVLGGGRSATVQTK